MRAAAYLNVDDPGHPYRRRSYPLARVLVPVAREKDGSAVEELQAFLKGKRPKRTMSKGVTQKAGTR